MFARINTSLLSKNKSLRIYRFISQKQDTTALPVVDISDFINGKQGDKKTCTFLIDNLAKYGCLAIKDPRVNEHLISVNKFYGVNLKDKKIRKLKLFIKINREFRLI